MTYFGYNNQLNCNMRDGKPVWDGDHTADLRFALREIADEIATTLDSLSRRSPLHQKLEHWHTRARTAVARTEG